MGGFIRCAKHHLGIWRLFFGPERREGRLRAMATLERLHEARPYLFTVSIIVGAGG